MTLPAPRGPRGTCGPFAVAVVLGIGTARAERLLLEARSRHDPRPRLGRVQGIHVNQALRVMDAHGIRGKSYWMDRRRRCPTLAEFLLTMAGEFDRRVTLLSLQGCRSGHFAVIHRGRIADNNTRAWVRYAKYPHGRVLDFRVERWWCVDRQASRRAGTR